MRSRLGRQDECSAGRKCYPGNSSAEAILAVKIRDSGDLDPECFQIFYSRTFFFFEEHLEALWGCFPP